MIILLWKKKFQINNNEKVKGKRRVGMGNLTKDEVKLVQFTSNIKEPKQPIDNKNIRKMGYTKSKGNYYAKNEYSKKKS